MTLLTASPRSRPCTENQTLFSQPLVARSQPDSTLASWCSLPQKMVWHLFSPTLWQVQADGTDGNCVTFVLHDEDHTLGNSLRYMVMKK